MGFQLKFDHKIAAELCAKNEGYRRFVSECASVYSEAQRLQAHVEDLRRELASRENEILVLKDALLESEEK